MHLNTFEMHAKCMFNAFKMYFQGMLNASQNEFKYVLNAFSIHVVQSCRLHVRCILNAFALHGQCIKTYLILKLYFQCIKNSGSMHACPCNLFYLPLLASLPQASLVPGGVAVLAHKGAPTDQVRDKSNLLCFPR